MKIKLFLLTLAFIYLGSLAAPVHAQAGIRLTNDRATLNFPETATFSAEIQASAQVTSVVLEYGVDQLTCGSVVAEAFPDFSPGVDVKVSWSWEMRQTGSLPPGAKLWWHWLVTDAGGGQFTSPEQTVTWLDSQHPWQTLSGGDINLHWYSGGNAFGQELHEAAAQALVRLTRDIGVGTDQPVDLYIYADTQDMQDAILYAPSWTGGQAFPENDIVIIGISPDELDWGKSSEAHELTHVLVGHETFSCLGFLPQWLSEGLAVYGQGGPDPSMQSTFDSALAGNTLASVQALSGNFPEASDKAYLAYGESYSLVNFLIQKYGREKMTALLLALRDGDTADQALHQVYAFDEDGLEDAWRAAIGAPSRSGNAQPTAVPTPTIVPTIEPISGVPVAQLAATLPASTPEPTSTPGAAAATGTPVPPQGTVINTLVNTLITAVGAVCILAVLAVAVWLIVIIVRRSRRAK